MPEFYNNIDEVISEFSRLSDAVIAERLAGNRELSGLDQFFGHLPPESMQATFTGLSNSQTFLQALTFLRLCEKVAAAQSQSFRKIERNGAIVDFGSGWGRITQLLSLYFRPENIVGCDVLQQALETVSKNGVKASFRHLHPWPPSCFKDESVDYIFSYSVFSHLSEDNSFAWIREFHRILKPGAMAFLTTRSRSFFDHLQRLHESSEVPHFAGGAKRAFADIERAKKEYDEGRFCFDPLGSGGKELTPVYGEAFIPPDYVHRKYGELYRSVGMENPIPTGLLDQATIWLRK